MNRPRGNAILIALFLSALLLALATGALMLMRPIARRLDDHGDWARAQAWVDRGLAQTLSAPGDPAQTNLVEEAGLVKVLAVRSENSSTSWRLHVRAAVRSGLSGTDAWAVECAQAEAVRDADGCWRVVRYTLLSRVRRNEP